MVYRIIILWALLFVKYTYENPHTTAPKRHRKCSFSVPCSKMPIGIFLFVLKSDLQKSEEEGEKRRKPEIFSGFLLGIFLSVRVKDFKVFAEK